MVIKFTIDNEEKTIRFDRNAKFSEIEEELNEIFTNDRWKREYTLIAVEKTVEYIPSVPYPTYKYYEYPWYDGTGGLPIGNTTSYELSTTDDINLS